jgi:hypothetical protein
MAGLPPFATAIPVLVFAWRLRALIRSFVRLQAVSPQSAVTPAALKTRQGPLFRRLQRQGVIAAADGGRYYVDQARYERWISVRRRRAIVILATLTTVTLIAWYAGWLRP